MADSFPILTDRRTTTGTILTGSGRLLGLIIEAPGSALSLTIYDDTDAATAANRIFIKGFADLAIGQVILFGDKGIPIATGIHYVETTSGIVLVLYSNK